MSQGKAVCVICWKRMSARIRCIFCQRHVCVKCSCDCRPSLTNSQVLTLPGGNEAMPYRVKCHRTGCRRYKSGYLTVHRSHFGGGAFYNKRGKLLADLREVDYLCPEHGIVDGTAPFLYPDPPKLKPGQRIHVDYFMHNGRRNRRAKATFIRLAKPGETVARHDFLVRFDKQASYSTKGNPGGRLVFVTADAICENK